MKHICTLIREAKVVGLAGSTHTAPGYDLYLQYRRRNLKKTHTLYKRAPLSLDKLVTSQH